MKYFKRTVLGLLVGLFVLGFIYCTVNKVTYDTLSIKVQNYLYAKQKDSEENDIPEDCGYDDVGGTPEEQDEYATQNNNYNISDVNQRVRSYLLDLMNQAFGYSVGGHIRVSIATNDTSATIKIYLADIKTPEDRNIAIQSCQESDLNSLHDGILNTYSNYGFSINNLDLILCDTFGVTILESQGGNMNSSDKYIDLGL